MRLLLRQVLGDFGPGIGEDDPNHLTMKEQSRMDKRRAKPKEPYDFAGLTSESPVKWLEDMSEYLRHARIEAEPEKIAEVRRYLIGQAKIWLGTLTNEELASFQNFEVAFRAKYLARDRKYASELDLKHRIQRPGEDPEVFIDEMILKGKELGWNDARIMDAMIEGLQQPLKHDVMLANPATLEAACNQIIRARSASRGLHNAEFTQVKQAIQDLAQQLKPKVATVEEPPQKPARPRRLPVFKNMTQGNAQPVQQAQPQPQPLVQQPQPIIIQASYPQQQQQERRQQDRATPSGNCFKCGQPGHFARNCPQKTSTSFTPICWKCNKPGHVQSQCRSNPRSNNNNNFQRRNFRRSPGNFQGRRPYNNRRQEN